jgi:hydroxypyruvate reductase
MTAPPERSEALARARGQAEQLFQAGLRAVDPRHAVREALRAADLFQSDEAAGTAPARMHVVAVGKAAVVMTQGALDALDGAIVSGDVITKIGHATETLPERIRVREASHPIPDERGVRATEDALDRLQAIDAETAVLALISGGGSALLEAPHDGLTLADLQATTNLLLRAGAPIEALNAVRACLSRVKAGGLRAAAPRSRWVTLILSDVLGNDPRVIASGPTVPGGCDAASALAIIDRYDLRHRVPAPVLAALERPGGRAAWPDTAQDVLRVIGDNAAAVQAAANAAQVAGLDSRIVWSAAEGEASALGRDWVAAVAAAPASLDVLLGGGEATVTVRGDGQGGRNTEFAVAAAIELERRRMDDWVVASLATDGEDALTRLAGAVVDSGTCQRARARGVAPEAALAQNDSLAAIEAAGDGVRTGPTGTNVNDLYLAVRVRD